MCGGGKIKFSKFRIKSIKIAESEKSLNFWNFCLMSVKVQLF